MSTFKAVIAKAVVDAGAGQPVVDALAHEDFEVVGAAAWAVEQMAQHGESVAGPLIEQGALKQLVDATTRCGRLRLLCTPLASGVCIVD